MSSILFKRILRKSRHGLGVLLCLTAGGLLAPRAEAISTVADPVEVSVFVVRGGASLLRVTPTNLAWKTINDPRFIKRINSDRLTCEYFPAVGPWVINAYHLNTQGSGALQGRYPAVGPGRRGDCRFVPAHAKAG